MVAPSKTEQSGEGGGVYDYRDHGAKHTFALSLLLRLGHRRHETQAALDRGGVGAEVLSARYGHVPAVYDDLVKCHQTGYLAR